MYTNISATKGLPNARNSASGTPRKFHIGSDFAGPGGSTQRLAGPCACSISAHCTQRTHKRPEDVRFFV